MAEDRDLSHLFSPDSIAIIGASDDPRKWGNWLAKGALKSEHRRRVHLVNHKRDSVLGRPTLRAASDIPGASTSRSSPSRPLPSRRPSTTRSCRALAPLSGISAGLGETGPAGLELEAAVSARVREAGAVLLGPNCLGLLDSDAELYLTSNELPKGPIGLISQSGNLALELGEKAALAQLGFSRCASTGNQADLDVADLIRVLASSDAVEAVAVYCEDFRDGRRFLEAAASCAAVGKPVVLLTVGTSRGRGQRGALAYRRDRERRAFDRRRLSCRRHRARVDSPADDRRHRRLAARIRPDGSQGRRARRRRWPRRRSPPTSPKQPA